MKLLREGQLEDFFETLEAMFSAIPYVLSSRQDERETAPTYFYTAFYLMLVASGGRSEMKC